MTCYKKIPKVYEKRMKNRPKPYEKKPYEMKSV